MLRPSCIAFLAGLPVLWLAAEREPTDTPKPLEFSEHFPKPNLPADNELTKERIALGERLFNDTILSIDGTVSCAACHVSDLAFSDDRRVSRGFEGRTGTRQSMPLFNLAWKKHFFWDGRKSRIRDQVLEPIQDHQEMAANLDHVLLRLNRRKGYLQEFENTYGPGPVTAEKLSLALENYLLTLVSDQSKYDDTVAGTAQLTVEEDRGKELFFSKPSRGGAGCFQCHGGATFTDSEFRNNGLAPTEDLGRHRVTGKAADKGLFVTPSLRNIELTAPYMHDGRFEALADVIAHYNDPIHQSPTVDKALPVKGLALSENDQEALIAFLKTLTDPRYNE
ncbi:cytochrome c peroxidase [Verrucomicrobiaceae bacterium 227]